MIDPDPMNFPPDPAAAMQTRLREDLRTAMRAKAAREVAVLRVCLAAIDNAQAVPVGDAHQTYELKAFGDASVEVPRLTLDPEAVQKVLAVERDDRLSAAAEYDRRGSADHGAALRADAEIISRYL